MAVPKGTASINTQCAGHVFKFKQHSLRSPAAWGRMFRGNMGTVLDSHHWKNTCQLRSQKASSTLMVNFLPFVHLCHSTNTTQTENFAEFWDCVQMKRKRICPVQNSSVLPGKQGLTCRTKTIYRSRFFRYALWAQHTGTVLMFIFYMTKRCKIACFKRIMWARLFSTMQGMCSMF